MAIPQTILVTGVNRGMGFSTVQGTALRNSIATYILTYRTPSSRQAVILKLQKLRVTAGLDVVELDITNHATIISAKKYIGKKYGLLMRGHGSIPKRQSLADLRENFNTTFKIFPVAVMISTFLTLLRLSANPKVINMFSGRASLSKFADGKMPPTAVLSYRISKAALNSITIEIQKAEGALREGEMDGEGWGKVEFWAVNLGHCKTAFNGSRETEGSI